MQPGDILYIPIGYYHQVENLSPNSLHYTVSLSFRPQISILDDIMASVEEQAIFDQLATKTKSMLNSNHPEHNSNNDDLENHVRDLIKRLSVVINDEAIVNALCKKYQQAPGNAHLKVFNRPSKELIDDLITNSK